MNRNDKIEICSFCGREHDEVPVLIAGYYASICSDCLYISQKIIEDETLFIRTGVEDDTINKEHRLVPIPAQINKMLDEYIVGQDFAKKLLSVSVYNHYKRIFSESIKSEIQLAKSNILLVGPTGSGKTLLAQTLAKSLNVPLVIVDATSITEAGYIGEDVESILQKLLVKCDYDIEKAESGIIYIDEIDKIAKRGNPGLGGRDVSGEGVQQALLKIIEGAVLSVPAKQDRRSFVQEYVTIDTSNILFICGGAFCGLEKIIKNRKSNTEMGFSTAYKSKEITDTQVVNQNIESQDLINFGLIPEFIGRLPVIAALEELTKEKLIQILQEPKNSIIEQYKFLFKFEEVDIIFEKSSLNLISEKAIRKKSGARGLRSITEHALLHLMYEIPSVLGLKKVIVH